MQPDDVYELTGAGDPRISPDGSRVAYVVAYDRPRESEYRSAIWVAPLDGAGEPRRFTSGEKRDGSPRWSPDGRWLAFVSNRGDEKAQGQLYVIPAEGGEARKLTELKESVSDVVWSPDSTRTRVHRARARRGVRGRGRPEARSRAASRGSSRSSTASAGPATAASTSSSSTSRAAERAAAHRRRLRGRQTRRGLPTASSIVFDVDCAASAGTSSSINGALRLDVDADGGEPKRLTRRTTARRARPSFSPDGSLIAYSLRRRGRHVAASRPGRA